MKLRSDLLTAELVYTAEIRAGGDPGSREFDGVLVPYNTVIDLGWGDQEAFDPGSIELHEQGLLILWQHMRTAPIGIATETRDTPEAFELTGRLSTTPTAADAYTLLRDGVVTRMSIGFEPKEYRVDEDGVIHWTKVTAREGSLVTFPAYDDAKVTAVRAAAQADANTKPNTKENAMPPTATEPVDLTELRATVTELSRSIDQLRGGLPAQAPAADTRTAGEVVRALATGDADTIRRYESIRAAVMSGERAYEGGTLADAISKNAWIGDLTRIVDASSGTISNFFSNAPLPATGMNLEHGELDGNTLVVDEQVAEGDAIGMGKVSVTTKTTPVHTYAGGASLSRQEIERTTNINILQTTLEGMATATGARRKAVTRAAYAALVADRRAIAADAGVVKLGATLAAGEAGHWEDMLVDAAIYFAKMSLSLDGLLVSGDVFKKLRSLTVSGERVFVTHANNSSGTLDLPNLKGDFAGLYVELDPDAAAAQAVFANKRAIRSYNSAMVSLTDEAILALTKSFATYGYGAVAKEIPAAVLPAKLSA